MPVGHESSIAELVNVARASGAAGVLAGDDLADKHGEALAAALAEAGLSTKVWPFAEAFAVPQLEVEREHSGALLRRQNPDAVASLIFTSGTTGKPKGVMLTHRNFTFMVSELSKVFEFGTSDGMLSVLPLSHTFEFSTGLLVPLAHGAQVTYLSELTGDAIGSALKKGRVTAIVGVPALWDLLRRRLFQRFADKSVVLEGFMKALAAANFELRSRTGVDLGMFLFLPVHEGFGGRIRYLISGGSALPADVMKAFYGMGFNFFEGYGLTETAPVLSVTSPKEKPIAGSVGQPLPGIEVKIAEPDPVTGIGEVIARGRNVMTGYWEDPEATGTAIRDGWFYTGDLGRFDEKGNLFLCGRSKDVIVDANGKNVYPDELEDLYRETPFVKELSVVGVPDGIGEQVACAVVPNLEHDPALPVAEVRARIEEHFRKISADLPIWKRVRTIHFWEGELPKTAKRSIKRREVAAEIARARRKDEEASGTLALAEAGDRAQVSWLLDTVASVSGRRRRRGAAREPLRRARVRQPHVRGAGERARKRGRRFARQRGPDDVGDRGRALRCRWRAGRWRRRGNAPARVRGARRRATSSSLRRWRRRASAGSPGRSACSTSACSTRAWWAPATFPSTRTSSSRRTTARTSTWGRSRWRSARRGRTSPRWRRRTTSSAIATAAPTSSTSPTSCRWSGRARSANRWIRRTRCCARGRSMVVFPEGTRSVTGEMADFLPSLGYLALRAEVGILPAHIAGSHEALPKGAALPQARDLAVSFGPFLSAEWLATLTAGLPGQEAWRLASAFVQRVVENLRDGVSTPLDADAARSAWDGKTLGPVAVKARSPRRRYLRSVP